MCVLAARWCVQGSGGVVCALAAAANVGSRSFQSRTMRGGAATRGRRRLWKA
jgi:hypothetical protein